MSMISYDVAPTDDILAIEHNGVREDIIRNAGIYAVTAGTSSALTLSIDSAYTSYTVGDKITCKIHETVASGATININSLGAKSIILPGGENIRNGAILKNSVVELIYNGTSFIYMNYDSNPDIFRDTGGIISFTDDVSLNAEVLSSTTIRIIKGATITYKGGNSQSIGMTSIWASANSVNTAIIVGGYIYTYLINTASESRIYRCLITDDISNAGNWAQLTISGYTLSFSSSSGLVGHDGDNFYVVDPSGFQTFTLSSTTLTFVATITVTGANYNPLYSRANGIGIYASFTSAPCFRFANHSGTLDNNRQCSSSAVQGFCTKNAFYVSGNNNFFIRNYV